MDNASKALIMAGAILISLALVGMGVYIFSISSNLQGDTEQTMDVMAAQTTNKQISNYAGDKVRGSTVRELMALVDTLNQQQIFPSNLTYGTATTYTTLAGSGSMCDSGDTIRESAYYEVVIRDELSSDGYLDTIYIEAY